MNLAEVPTNVQRSTWSKSKTMLPSGLKGEPSESRRVAPAARTETSQFHIFQPHVVKENCRSTRFMSLWRMCSFRCFFFFNDTATTEIYTLSLHDALPI